MASYVKAFHPGTSISCVRVVHPPILDPLLNPVLVRLHLLRCVAGQFDDDLFIERFTRLFDDYLHDLCIQIFLQFRIMIVSEQSQLTSVDKNTRRYLIGAA